MYVFYFTELLQNAASFKINTIIFEFSPIDFLISRNTIKKVDLFNQVASQLRDFEENPMTADVKVSCDCQPTVDLLPLMGSQHKQSVSKPTIPTYLLSCSSYFA